MLRAGTEKRNDGFRSKHTISSLWSGGKSTSGFFVVLVALTGKMRSQKFSVRLWAIQRDDTGKTGEGRRFSEGCRRFDTRKIGNFPDKCPLSRESG